MCFMRICEFVTINSRCTDFLRSTTVIGNVSAPKTASERILAGQEQLKD